MKVEHKSKKQNYIQENGVFKVDKLYKYTPLDRGVVNISAVMNFTPEQQKLFDEVFYKTMAYLDNNIKVELGKFGTVCPVLECESKKMCELMELSEECIKRVNLKLKPSKELKEMLEQMKDSVQVV